MFIIMKIVGIVLFVLIAMHSCQPQKNILINLNSANTIKTICPQDGHCSFSYTPNTALSLKKDAFGLRYIEKIDSKSTLVIFEYERHEDQNAADSHYIERIYIQLPQQPKALHIVDQDLQQVNLIFERLCYCKGATGVYEIKEGTLSLKPLSEHRFHLNLSFKSSEVPQILSTIDEILNIE